MPKRDSVPVGGTIEGSPPPEPRGWEGFLDGLTVAAAFATVPIVILGQGGQQRDWVELADWTVWSIFLIDFLSGFAAGRRERRSRSGHVIGGAVVFLSYPGLPDLLALSRMARVARLIRVVGFVRLAAVTLRGFRAIRHSLGGRSLLYTAAVTTLLTLAAGAGLAFIEPQTVGDGLWGGLWWAVVTVTTVGYGDISPATPVGRLLAVGLMLLGLGLLSTLAGSISALLIGQEEQPEIRALAARLDEMDRKLDRLLAAVRVDLPDK